MKKAAVIGHFGFGLEYLDGQTVKTKMLAEELCRRLGEDQVMKIDTHGGAKTLLKAPFQIFRALKSSENIIILPAHNGLRVNAPLLSFEQRFFKNKRLHYVVIGGWLPAFLKEHASVAKALRRFDGIYVETNTMKRALEKYGFSNVILLPNCKKLAVLNEESLRYDTAEPHRLCTFSRVMKEKGMEDAIRAVQFANDHFGRTVYTLDIYGPVDPAQTAWFEELRSRFSPEIHYCGCVDANKSVEILQHYFALLFPTHFFTEGIPGTIIDAYAAGVPVISAKWESFADVVEDGKTGIGYEFDDAHALETVLLQVAETPAILTDMKTNCICKAKDYTPETALNVLFRHLSNCES